MLKKLEEYDASFTLLMRRILHHLRCIKPSSLQLRRLVECIGLNHLIPFQQLVFFSEFGITLVRYALVKHYLRGPYFLGCSMFFVSSARRWHAETRQEKKSDIISIGDIYVVHYPSSKTNG